MLRGQGMYQQMSLGPSQPCWSCRRHVCCSSCVPRDDEKAPHSEPVPALCLPTAQPGCRGRGELKGAVGQCQLGWGSLSSHDLAAGLLLRPNPASVRAARSGTGWGRRLSPLWDSGPFLNQKIPSPPAALRPAGRWGALGEQQPCGRASFPGV